MSAGAAQQHPEVDDELFGPAATEDYRAERPPSHRRGGAGSLQAAADAVNDQEDDEGDLVLAASPERSDESAARPRTPRRQRRPTRPRSLAGLALAVVAVFAVGAAVRAPSDQASSENRGEATTTTGQSPDGAGVGLSPAQLHRDKIAERRRRAQELRVKRERTQRRARVRLRRKQARAARARLARTANAPNRPATSAPPVATPSPPAPPAATAAPAPAPVNTPAPTGGSGVAPTAVDREFGLVG